MVMRQLPMALHARRSLISNAVRRCATAFRFPAGVTILSQEILQRRIVQHGVGQQPLQPGVLSRLASETSIPPNFAFHL
jgi:hypothetical protein